MWRKLINIVLILTIIASVSVGCFSKESINDNSSTDTTDTSNETIVSKNETFNKIESTSFEETVYDYESDSNVDNNNTPDTVIEDISGAELSTEISTSEFTKDSSENINSYFTETSSVEESTNNDHHNVPATEKEISTIASDEANQSEHGIVLPDDEW